MPSRNSSNGGGGPSSTTTAPTCMCDDSDSCARNDASIAVSRSRCSCAIVSPCCGSLVRVPPYLASPGRVPDSREDLANPCAAAGGGIQRRRLGPRAVAHALQQLEQRLARRVAF